MKRIYILSALFLFTALSCNNAKELEEEVETIVSVPEAQVSMNWDAYTNNAGTTIKDVRIAENKMSITVEYSGGCAQHEFELVGHKMVSKSLPPQRTVKLFHNGNGDTCRELVEEILIFDILPLASGNGEITLKMTGYDKPISYIPVR